MKDVFLIAKQWKTTIFYGEKCELLLVKSNTFFHINIYIYITVF